MLLSSIRMLDFRCYNHCEITFDSKFNVIYGLNGQGKTSLLEAISLLSTFKSFRIVKNKILINYNANEALIAGKIEHDDLSYELDVHITAGKKQALFNKKKCKYLSEYISKVTAVTFSPADLEIIRGAPEYRRNTLDRVAQVISPIHANLVNDYQKTIEQRNKLLKRNRDLKVDAYTDEIESWDEKLVKLGVEIRVNRLNACSVIENRIERFYNIITNQNNSIKLQYLQAEIDEEDDGQAGVLRGSFYDLEGIQNSLKASFRMNYRKDLILGTTSSGPHRDDLKILLNQHLIRSFGSQGEIRSLVLAIRLSEVELSKEIKGYSPLLLIDDFSSELDFKRRKFLLDFLVQSGSQVFLTTTEKLEIGKVFKAENGRVEFDGGQHAIYRNQ